MTSNDTAAVVLARALADAINPERPADTAYLGNALFCPLAARVISLLADGGYRLERIDPPAPVA